MTAHAMALDPRSILVIDDNPIDREAVVRMLRSEHTVSSAATATQGLEMAQSARPDCVLVDYRLPDGDGLQVLEQLSADGLASIVMTGMGSESIAVEAMKRGARDYLVKGTFDRGGLLHSIERALEQVRLEREVARQRAELERHVVELERTNQALNERESTLRLLLDQLPAAVWVVGRDLGVESLRGRASDLVAGMPGEVAGLRLDDSALRDTVLAATTDACRRALRGERSALSVRTEQGATIRGVVQPLMRDGSVDGAVALAVDVSEQEELADQLRQAQKLEAIGRLAGSVAHDFNNLLTVIVGFNQMVLADVPADSQWAKDLGEVDRAASNAKALVDKLLAFSRRTPTRPRTVAPGDVLLEDSRMLQSLVGDRHKVELDVDRDLWSAIIDPAALGQVVVNLVVNARDAMPEGGTIRVRAVKAVVEEDEQAAGGQTMPAGDYVRVEVVDQGCGIAKERLGEIFEPFFTTKAAGAGTGLGLSICLGTVTQIGGYMTVESEVGGGTTFAVYLPRAGSRE